MLFKIYLGIKKKIKAKHATLILKTCKTCFIFIQLYFKKLSEEACNFEYLYNTTMLNKHINYILTSHNNLIQIREYNYFYYF